MLPRLRRRFWAQRSDSATVGSSRSSGESAYRLTNVPPLMTGLTRLPLQAQGQGRRSTDSTGVAAATVRRATSIRDRSWTELTCPWPNFPQVHRALWQQWSAGCLDLLTDLGLSRYLSASRGSQLTVANCFHQLHAVVNHKDAHECVLDRPGLDLALGLPRFSPLSQERALPLAARPHPASTADRRRPAFHIRSPRRSTRSFFCRPTVCALAADTFPLLLADDATFAARTAVFRQICADFVLDRRLKQPEEELSDLVDGRVALEI